MPENYRITGSIRGEDNLPGAGYTVQAFDKDRGIYGHPDDRLGKAKTLDDGTFSIEFTKDDFKDWFEDEPRVYLEVRDPEGRVVLKTPDKKNSTGRIDFQIKLGKPRVDPLAPDVYAGNLQRIISAFRNLGDAVDVSRVDVRYVLDSLLGSLTSWTVHRDMLARFCGYDGIQVPEQPRKEEHIHVTRWDEEVLRI